MQPWKTIYRVDQSLAGLRQPQIMPGDTIHFMRGQGQIFTGPLVILGGGGTANAPITITSYGAATDPLPIIYAGSGNGIVVQDAGNIIITSLEIMGNYHPAGQPSGETPSNGNGIQFTNMSGSNKGAITIQNVTIHGFGGGLALQGPGGNGIKLLGNPNSAPNGDQIPSYQNITISNCQIYNNSTAGILTDQIMAYPPSGPSNVFENVSIDNVEVYNIMRPSTVTTAIADGQGIKLTSVNQAVVQYCQAHDNGTSAYQSGGDGFSTYYSTHVLLQYNQAYSNHSANQQDQGGFDFDQWTTNSIMQFNYSHDNDGYGYMLGGIKVDQLMAGNNIIRYNISENDCRNSNYGALLFEKWSPSDVYVYNNTFYMGNNSPNVTVPAPAIGFNTDGKTPRNTYPVIKLYNNLFLTQDRMVPSIRVLSGFPTPGLTFQANDYYCTDRTTPIIMWQGAPLTLTTFQGQPYAQESLGTSGNPALSFNPTTAPTVPDGGFKLTNGSIDSKILNGGVQLYPTSEWWAPDNYWINLFTNMNLPPQDFFGVHLPTTRAGPFSMGASQYQP